MEKNYEKISDELREEMVELIKKTIIDTFQKEKIKEHFYRYEVQFQTIKFMTCMTDEELDKSIELTIDLMEELKNINNGGMTGQVLKEKAMQLESEYEDELIRDLFLWEELCNKEVKNIIRELNVVRRVGGAYAMIISNPCFKSAIYGVYEMIVDKFDDDTLYCQSAFFLARAVMRMHSNEM